MTRNDLLHSLRIPDPRPRAEAVKDQRVDFCETCQAEVHNLSVLTRAEANAFLARRRGRPTCVSYRMRPSGEIVTADPPARPWRGVVVALATAAAACGGESGT